MPRFLEELFDDLRQRRLLPVVAALAIAVIAVPVLIGGGGGEAAPVSPVAGDGEALEGAEQAQPVVLTDDPGLRDFRKRLDRFERKNPFRQQLSGAPKGADDGAVESGPGAGGGSPTPETSSTPAPGPSESSAPTATGGPPARGGDGGGEQRPAAEPELRLFTLVLDVRVGPVGETKVRRGVQIFSFLPRDGKPIAQYVSADLKGTKAAFIVSPEVERVSGDGRCRPGKKRCEFLLLNKGEEAKLDYGPDGTRYRLKLLGVRIVELDEDEVAPIDQASKLLQPAGK